MDQNVFSAVLESIAADKREEMSFEKYFNQALEDCKQAKDKGTISKYVWTAPMRVYHMVMSHGVEIAKGDPVRGITDKVTYNFFKDRFFGIDDSIEKLMEYLKSAATDPSSEVGRRILLLYGPTSSGKSQLAVALRRGIEEYSYTDEGAVYRIKGCPNLENPLNAVPRRLREKLMHQHGLFIEGDLCPHCRYKLENDYDNDVSKLEVERLYISEANRSGIGTFTPSDPKTQDISELIGAVDLNLLAKYGTQADPRAYRFNGEINIANRGILECIEMLKVDRKFLHTFITLAQERNIKVPQYPLVYADTFILAHTNETEFRKFFDNKENEAHHDRMILVKVPYNLEVSGEVKIYKKMLMETPAIQDVHIAPYALEVAAQFAILSRLSDIGVEEEPIDLMKKMKLYNGQNVDEYTGTDIIKMRKNPKSKEEGMHGVSPRYVVNRLTAAIVADPGSKVPCLNPLDVLRSLENGLDSNGKLTEEDKLHCKNILKTVWAEYSKVVKGELQKAIQGDAFQEEKNKLLQNYIDNAIAYCEDKKIFDPITKIEVEPDEKLMRSIEEKIHITSSAKDQFRDEVVRKVLLAKNRGDFDFTAHPKLKEALEKELFDRKQDLLRLVQNPINPDETERKKIDAFGETLRNQYGYCKHCSDFVLRYGASLMGKQEN